MKASSKASSKSERDEPKGMGRTEVEKKSMPNTKKDNKDCKPTKKRK